jgi:hypothetical protein
MTDEIRDAIHDAENARLSSLQASSMSGLGNIWNWKAAIPPSTP